MNDLLKYLDNPELINEENDPDLWKNIVNNYPYFQSAHIFHCLAENLSGEVRQNESIYIAAIYSGDRTRLFQLLNNASVGNEMTEESKSEDSITSNPHENTLKSDAKTTLTRHLIDNFLASRPAPARFSDEFFNASAAANRSISDEFDFISENLAIIYAKAGNIDKAIKIYHKLSLIYPEKSNYFALQIEKLSNKKEQ